MYRLQLICQGALIFFLVLCPISVFAKQQIDININKVLNSSSPEVTINFSQKEAGEVIGKILIESEGLISSNSLSSTPISVLTLFLNGVYNQDLVLFRGKNEFTYQFSLGFINASSHRLKILYNQKKTKFLAEKITLKKLRLETITPSCPDYIIYKYSPIFYGREDNNYSDIPLIMYYEKDKEGGKLTITYTVIWSNEDEGTDTPHLFARWGRAVDIEWIYQITLDENEDILKEVYQGAAHFTKHFKGEKDNFHPLLFTITKNNNMSDKGRETPFKFRLVPVISLPADKSREEILDLFPWIYEVMAEELRREGKLEEPGNPYTVAPSDPRNYLYIDFQGKGVSFLLPVYFQVKLKNDDSWYSSDHNKKGLRVYKSGYMRTAIELPPGTELNSVEKIKVGVDFPPMANNLKVYLLGINKVFTLNKDYQPLPSIFSWEGEIVLTSDYNFFIFEL